MEQPAERPCDSDFRAARKCLKASDSAGLRWARKAIARARRGTGVERREGTCLGIPNPESFADWSSTWMLKSFTRTPSGSAAPRLIRPCSRVEVRHESALRLGKLRAGHRRCRFFRRRTISPRPRARTCTVADAEHGSLKSSDDDGAHEARIVTLHIGLRAFERTVALVLIQRHRASDVGHVVNTPRATPQGGRGASRC